MDTTLNILIVTFDLNFLTDVNIMLKAWHSKYGNIRDICQIFGNQNLV